MLICLCEEGVIKGWGFGVNKVELIEFMFDLEEVKLNIFLLVGCYLLLDYECVL